MHDRMGIKDEIKLLIKSMDSEKTDKVADLIIEICHHKKDSRGVVMLIVLPWVIALLALIEMGCVIYKL